MRRRSCRIYLFAFLSLSTAVEAAPKRLENVPASRDLQGDAFVAVWTAFRSDLDSLAELDVHPALFDEWFDAMPQFLLIDAVRLATQPKVVTAAASRLALIGGETNLKLLEDLQKAMRDSEAKTTLKALSIVAGDQEQRRAAYKNLKNPSSIIQIQAAKVLAISGQERGRAYLRSLVRGGGENAGEAARILGRFGRDSDSALLARAARANPGNDAFSAARGELAFKKLFANHYRAFLLRFPSEVETGSRWGIYETWLLAIDDAVQNGARDAADALKAFESRKSPLREGMDHEVQNRHLSALATFWRGVDEQIRATDPSPRWPADFSSAMKIIRRPHIRKDNSPEDESARIAAEISVLSALGERLEWARLSTPPSGVAVLTPGAGRVADGNMATSWCAKRGDALELETESEVSASAVEVMNRCPLNERAKTTSIRITGYGSKTWSIDKKLKAKTDYFETITLPGKKARRFSIEILSTLNDKPACIAEIRLK